MSAVVTNETAEHVNFASIDQCRAFLKSLRRHYETSGIPEQEIPKIFHLRGTVKLHGSHSDLYYTKDGEQYKIHYQSRNRVITPKSDNCGFATHMETLSGEDKYKLIRFVEECYEKTGSPTGQIETVMIAGEYCGGNIQKGVALSKLEKMFVIYAIKINGCWQNILDYKSIELPDKSIYNILRVPHYTVTLNMNESETTVSELKRITDQVEKECPWGKLFGVSGVGEGVVWICEELGSRSEFWFKVKGEEHAVSKVTTLKEKSAEERAALKNANEFAEKAAAEGRLRQGLDYLREMGLEEENKNIGVYIKWIVDDTLKEEAEAIQEYEVSVPHLKKALGTRARNWYMKNAGKEQEQQGQQ